MPTDLTERLAAKLAKDGLMFTEPIDNTPAMRLSEASRWLPLLLSEPELVASLPDAVRLSVLTPRERMALEIGLLELDLSKAEAKALTPEVPRVG